MNNDQRAKAIMLMALALSAQPEPKHVHEPPAVIKSAPVRARRAATYRYVNQPTYQTIRYAPVMRTYAVPAYGQNCGPSG